MREELRDLSVAVQQLSFRMDRLEENEAHEREKTLLKLENALLKFERRMLPPGRLSGRSRSRTLGRLR